MFNESNIRREKGACISLMSLTLAQKVPIPSQILDFP
jgi:hypothetical protein